MFAAISTSFLLLFNIMSLMQNGATPQVCSDNKQMTRTHTHTQIETLQIRFHVFSVLIDGMFHVYVNSP